MSFTPTFSGGSWSGSLPLTNLQDRRLEKVARSTNALAASTQFDVDLKTARAVGILALPKHNLTTAATVRWTGGTTSGASDVYDSGALAMSFSATTAEDADGINFAHVHVPAALQTARFWRCAIVDTANPAGFVDLGRLVIAGKYQPAVNFSPGLRLPLQADTNRQVTDGGAAQYQAKLIRRGAVFTLENMAEAEAFASGWKMQRQLGLHKQVFFVYDTADTTLMHERAFLAVMRELGGIEAPYAALTRNASAFSLVEEL